MNALNALARVVGAPSRFCALLVGAGAFRLLSASHHEPHSSGNQQLRRFALFARSAGGLGHVDARLHRGRRRAHGHARHHSPGSLRRLPPALKGAADKQAALASLGERYTLTDDALTILTTSTASSAQRASPSSSLASHAWRHLPTCSCAAGRKSLGGVLMASGAAVIAVFALLALWVTIDFNGFFAAFHSLFFSAGTWTFSYDSLLICMYPPDFWISMGAVWLVTTLAGCLICLIIGPGY